MDKLKKRHDLILEWFQLANQYLQSIEDKKLKVTAKENWNNLVTEADKYIEQKFVQNIRLHFPNENIISEEGFGDESLAKEGINWFIDPIDGTTNFVTMKKHYAIMLAIYEDGVGQAAYIYNKDEEALYVAIKDKGLYRNNKQLSFHKNDYSLSEGIIGMNSSMLRSNKYDHYKKVTRYSLGIRSKGSAGLELLDLALGNQVAFLSTHLSPWDLAPGLVFLNERGIVAQQLNGETPSLQKSEGIIAAYPSAFGEIEKYLKK